MGVIRYNAKLTPFRVVRAFWPHDTLRMSGYVMANARVYIRGHYVSRCVYQAALMRRSHRA